MMRKWTSIAIEMWKDRRPIFQQLGVWLVCFQNVSENGHFALPEDWFPWSTVVDAKGSHVSSLSGAVGIFTAVWAMEGGQFLNQGRGKKKTGRNKQKHHGFKAVLWLYKALWAAFRKWPRWGVGFHWPLDHYLGYCLGYSSWLESEPWR